MALGQQETPPITSCLSEGGLNWGPCSEVFKIRQYSVYVTGTNINRERNWEGMKGK
jgi:hypothetical protein